MQRACYRCGAQMEEQIPFCPSCGAPQIRVSAPLEAQPAAPPDAPAKSPALEMPSGFGVPGKIEWKKFFRIAAPVSAITGFMTVPLALIGLVVLLPGSVIWGISRYRRYHLGPLRTGHGARLGAALGLLSFGFFLLSFWVSLALNRGAYRAEMIQRLQNTAAHTPDPQVQQIMHWFATNEGLVALMAFGVVLFLIIFLIVATVTGALTAAFSGDKKMP